MENMGDPKNIVQELLQGLELARQLQVYLHVPSSPQESHDLLIQKIISTFEKALEMINWKGSMGEPSGVAIRMSESPPFSSSPRSEDSDRELRDQEHNGSKKRSTLPRWTKQIRVNPGMGVEGPLDDGFSWRKYGQKDILGAIHPRGYYRCTHRNVQGCLATKQVQRSDEDPTVFEITYRGKHTCTASSNAVSISTPLENQEPNMITNPYQDQNVLQILEHQSKELLSNLREGLRVQTENLDSPNQPPQFPPFNFPSSSNIKIENQVFHSPVLENFNSPSYVSPATSGISNFSVSPSGVHIFNFGSSASQINDMIPTAASAVNSPTVGLDFPFDQFEFDGQNFTFDNPRFFS